MNILVFVKAVPIVEGVTLTISGTDIVKSELKYAMNEWDEYALEEAVLLKEKYGGIVTVATLSNAKERSHAERVLREAIAKGADEAVHLVDENFQNLNSSATANLLSHIARKIPFDLILTGVQSMDDGCAQTGGIIADILRIPQACLVTKLEYDTNRKYVKVHRELEEGIREIVELPLPALLTIQLGINTPRLAPFAKIRAAVKKEIRTLGLRELQLTVDDIKQWFKSTIIHARIPSIKKKVQVIQGKPEDEASELIKALQALGFRGG